MLLEAQFDGREAAAGIRKAVDDEPAAEFIAATALAAPIHAALGGIAYPPQQVTVVAHAQVG
jgi:hypothetical protein